MHRSPDYSAAYVVLAHRRPGALGPRPDVHERPRHRGLRRRRSVRSSRSSSGARSRASPATSPASGAASSPRTSCAGSGRRRASCTSRPRRSSTPSGTCGRRRGACRSGGCSPTSRPRRSSSTVDFRYISDAITPEEAVDLLRAARAGRRASARTSCARAGYPAYTTSAGWLGYDDEKVEQLVRLALARRLPPREDEGRRRHRRRTSGAPA